MSDPVRPHRRQPTRLPGSWDSPGKNNGVGCHFLLQCMKVKSEIAQSFLTLATPWTAAYQAPPSMKFSRQEYWNGMPLQPAGTSQIRDPTLFSCIGRQSPYRLATREILIYLVQCNVKALEKAMALHSSTLAWKIPWREEPSRLQSMGSLESDMTERLHFHFSFSCIGERNGNPLQCPCLENPRDSGAWWAVVSGVAQTRTRLSDLAAAAASEQLTPGATTTEA